MDDLQEQQKLFFNKTHSIEAKQSKTLVINTCMKLVSDGSFIYSILGKIKKTFKDRIILQNLNRIVSSLRILQFDSNYWWTLVRETQLMCSQIFQEGADAKSSYLLYIYIHSMKYTKKQFQGLINDQTINCSWNTEKQPTNPCFLRRMKTFDNPERLEIENLKSLSKAMISVNTPKHTKNKVSLKREKEKDPVRMVPQQYPQRKREEIQYLPHSPQRQVVIAPRNIAGISPKQQIPFYGNYNINSIQNSNKYKTLNISFTLSSPSTVLVEMNHPVIASPINQLTHINSSLGQEKATTPSMNVNIESQTNTGFHQKQQFLEDVPRLAYSASEMTFNGQREVATLNHSRQMEPMNEQLVKTKKNTMNGDALRQQMNKICLKRQNSDNSDMSLNSLNEFVNPSLINIQDLVETQSVTDETDVKESVVVGTFFRFQNNKKRSMEEKQTNAAQSLIDKRKVVSLFSI